LNQRKASQNSGSVQKKKEFFDLRKERPAPASGGVAQKFAMYRFQNLCPGRQDVIQSSEPGEPPFREQEGREQESENMINEPSGMERGLNFSTSA